MLGAGLRDHAAVVGELLRRAGSLARDQWHRPRAPGKWTPAQEIEHLVLSYADWAKEVRSGPPVTPDTFAERIPGLREHVLPRILQGGWFPDGARAPGPVVPGIDRADPELLLEDLQRNVAEFERALLAESVLNVGRFLRHPYFGALTLEQSLRVCIEHTRHHAGFLPDAP